LTSLDRQANSQPWDEWQGGAVGALGDGLTVDYVPDWRATLASFRLQTRWRVTLAWVSGAFGLTLALTTYRQPTMPWGLFLVSCAAAGLAFGAVMMGALWAALLPYRAWNAHRLNPALFGPTQFIADDAGAEFITDRGSMKYRWSDFQGYREGSSVFVLCIGRSAGYALPKTAMSSQFVADFRAELDRRLRRLR
jgi:hypothetical protein